MLSIQKLPFLILALVALCSCTSQNKNATSLIMPDGKEWTTKNLNIDVPGSVTFDSLAYQERYGRLYTWKDATTVCAALGEGWRLPSQEDWRTLAKHYGGVFSDSTDGKGPFVALMEGGESKFNAVLSGGSSNGEFWRVDAHGFYWTNTSVNDTTAWFINFGKGRPALFLQNDGAKHEALAVRCVKD